MSRGYSPPDQAGMSQGCMVLAQGQLHCSVTFGLESLQLVLLAKFDTLAECSAILVWMRVKWQFFQMQFQGI